MTRLRFLTAPRWKKAGSETLRSGIRADARALDELIVHLSPRLWRFLSGAQPTDTDVGNA